MQLIVTELLQDGSVDASRLACSIQVFKCTALKTLAGSTLYLNISSAKVSGENL